MSSFDPTRNLVMASAKTVLGHAMTLGNPLKIVEEPAAAGEVDEAMARRLHASKLAVYQEDLSATPVESPEQERNRLSLEALRESGGTNELTPTSDLLVHPAETPKAGKKVTKDDLIEIAGLEGVVVETDDNKPDLIRKITEARASRAVANETNAETEGAGGQGDTAAQGTGGPESGEGADSGAGGDAHGEAGEGPSDAE